MVTDEVRSRVRGYMQAQAAKLSVEEIGARVDAAFDELTSVLMGLSGAQVSFKPTSDEWGVAECMAHLTLADERVCKRILALASGEDAALGELLKPQPTDEDVLALVTVGRNQLSRLVAEFPKEPVLAKTAEHGAFGPLNCKEWLVFLRVHILDHKQQIQALRDHPEFPR